MYLAYSVLIHGADSLVIVLDIAVGFKEGRILNRVETSYTKELMKK